MANLTIQSALMQSQHALTSNFLNLGQSLNRLSTGLSINRGADNPSGLIASETLRSYLAELDAEVSTLQRVDSVAAVADGALAEQSTLLGEVKAIEVQLANESGLSGTEADALRMERDAKLQAFDRLSQTASFNGEKLFDGRMTLAANETSITLGDLSLSNTGATDVTVDGATVSATLRDVLTGGLLEDDRESSASVIDTAIDQLATLRGQIGSFQSNTVWSRMNTVFQTKLDTMSAESMIRDTDYAAEAAELTRQQLLFSASSTSFGALLNQQTSVLDLLA